MTVKLITFDDNTIINAESVDYIDIHFEDDGDYLYIDLLLHGETKRLDYRNTNGFFFKVNDGKNFMTPYGIKRCDVKQNQEGCTNHIMCELLLFLQRNDVTILDLSDVIRETIGVNKGEVLYD